MRLPLRRARRSATRSRRWRFAADGPRRVARRAAAAVLDGVRRHVAAVSMRHGRSLTRQLAAPMRDDVGIRHALAAGDLTADLQIARHDDLGDVLHALNQLKANLAAIVYDVRAPDHRHARQRARNFQRQCRSGATHRVAGGVARRDRRHDGRADHHRARQCRRHRARARSGEETPRRRRRSAARSRARSSRRWRASRRHRGVSPTLPA